MAEVFWQFFKLGWISFGGPAAHIGYFRTRFVEELKWLSDEHFGQFVALSHFLPGPGSSQVGFAIGHHRNGLLGGLAAFLGFTLPSILIMLVLAIYGLPLLPTEAQASIVDGLKLLAVLVVADAIWGMGKNFCKTKMAILIAMVVLAINIIFSDLLIQLSCLVAAAAVGQFKNQEFKNKKNQMESSDQVKASYSGLPYLLVFLVLVLALPLMANQNYYIQFFNDFYQAGSWVFGGGHVVLPILQQTAGASLSQEEFLTGYAVAQGVPGPMFTLATYLGAVIQPHNPIVGGLLATLAIFLPGFLLLIAALSNWQWLQQINWVQKATWGVNAAVVGLLASALINPVIPQGIQSIYALIPLAIGYVLLKRMSLAIWWVISFFILSGFVLNALT